MQQSPHFYVTHEYDVGALLERRKEINSLLAEDDKLSLNDFIVRAVALTLLEFPNLNASLDLKNSGAYLSWRDQYWRSCGSGEWLAHRGKSKYRPENRPPDLIGA